MFHGREMEILGQLEFSSEHSFIELGCALLLTNVKQDGAIDVKVGPYIFVLKCTEILNMHVVYSFRKHHVYAMFGVYE